MPCKRQWAVVVISLAALLVQSCTMQQRMPDLKRQQLALQRWNGCLVRAGVKADEMCEGHKRDVLVTYPAHLERQVNEKMTHQYQRLTAAQAWQTRYESAVKSRQGTDL